MKRIWLTIGIILLLIGVIIAPIFNFNTVRASQDDDLVEVTAQGCGIKGYGNTTVKLTRQQYQNLEQYLVEFRARLNQTTSREEAVPIFKEAVVELDKYGLLGGLSVENEMRFLTMVNQGLENFEKLSIFSKLSEASYGYTNVFCFVIVHATGDILEFSPLLLPFLPLILLLIMIGLFYPEITFFNLLLEGVAKLYGIVAEILYSSPLKFWISLYGSNNECWSIGLKGYKHSEIISSVMYGFKGLRVILPTETYYIGHALAIES